MREGVTGSLPASWWGFLAARMQQQPQMCAELQGAIDLAQEYQRSVARVDVIAFGDSFDWLRTDLPAPWWRWIARRLSELRDMRAECGDGARRGMWVEHRLDLEREAAKLALSMSIEFDAATREVAP